MEDIERGLDERKLKKMFSSDIDKIPLLTPEEESVLIEKARGGCTESANRLTEANLRLVLKVAYKMWRPGFPLMDLVSEGCLGLIKAIRAFNPEMGFRISSYAVPAIEHAVINAIGAHCKHNHSSLDDLVFEDDETTHKDLLVSKETSADDHYFDAQVKGLLNALTTRERKVIELRFWRDKTLDEIGAIIGVCKQHVGQIEARALRKLRWAIYKTSNKEDWYADDRRDVFLVA